MNSNEPSLLIGVSIISEMHQNFEEECNDDREHISNLSLIIKGISGYLDVTEMPKTECREIISELTKYGKKLWIDTCLEQSDDGESEQEIREESEHLFDYIFENHDYPE